MIRLVRLGTATAFALLGVIAAAPGAQAEPPPPCGFTLSPPAVEQVAGVATVVATVTPGVCISPGSADLSVACLQALDGSSQVCSQGRGPDGARVQLSPVRPGVTYESTGRGLPRWLGQDPARYWQVLGPYAATLG
ncbi:hypothetical protein [Mycolicibacterium arenosum]|uniref:Secreted protein n=1 Tax=Mycolicibacterium arenosum TaxID=2952157 RepID=A0ABT1M474_9MYCO|nr:hypothetical protein [Mycolicibacterium sp. CAU 1645]MCP9273044.1 hypothetical protein [Mycolicibacterium sp. CAU 1645]